MEQKVKIQALIDRLADGDSTIRNEARNELVEIGSDAVGALVEVMTTQSGRPSWEAAKALANINDSRCLPIMERMLVEGNVIIAQTAVTALINYQPNDLVGLFNRALANTHQVVKLKIIESLGELNQQIDPQPLMEILASTDSASIRYTIIDTLLKQNIRGDYGLVVSFADDPDRHVQKRVQRYREHFK